jgi:hypothetical protein
MELYFHFPIRSHDGVVMLLSTLFVLYYLLESYIHPKLLFSYILDVFPCGLWQFSFYIICAISRKVAGSRPDEVNSFFQCA